VFRDRKTKSQAKWLRDDPRLDTNMPSQSIAAYRAAWSLWRKVHQAGAPKPIRQKRVTAAAR
jgi:hypothetical protein